MTDVYKGSLSPHQQQVITHLHDGGMSVRAIAKQEDVSYGIVRGFVEWLLEDSSGEFPKPVPILPPHMIGLAGPPVAGPKVLIYDIETAPAAAWVWSAYKTNILGMKQDWYLLSFAYKWLGQKGTHFVSLPQDPSFTSGSTDDLWVAARLASLFDAADVVIAHNGDNFDQKKANARFLYHGIDPPSPYQQIDTLKEARRYFNNYQNSLKELGRIYTKEDKMSHEGFDLWLGCMAGDPEKWATMEKYNRQDVRVLERLYRRLLPARTWSSVASTAPRSPSFRPSSVRTAEATPASGRRTHSGTARRCGRYDRRDSRLRCDVLDCPWPHCLRQLR
jgi:hypothetical protein